MGGRGLCGGDWASLSVRRHSVHQHILREDVLSGTERMPVATQQTKSRCDNVVTTLCFGCGNVVNATLSQRKNVDSKSRCGHVAITTLHSQPACIFMHTHIHTYTHIYTEFDNSRPWSRDNSFF